MLQVALASGTFLVERSWGQLPAGVTRLELSAVATSGDGRVAVLQRSDPAVWIYTEEGEVIRSLSLPILDGHGVSWGEDDDLLVVDRDGHRVLVYNLVTDAYHDLGGTVGPSFQAPFNHPTAIAVHLDTGAFFVSDGYGNAMIHHFDANEDYLASWGTPGRNEGELCTPHDLWVDPSIGVLVADRDNDRIQVFSFDGELLAVWRDVVRPMGITGLNGTIVVTEAVPRLSQFTFDGELVGRCRLFAAGSHSVAVGKSGALFVAERPCAEGSTNVTCLAPKAG